MREDDRSDDQLDADDRALVAKLRELPPEGTEPDWQQLEAAIRAEVGDDAPRPWWRNWRWIVPVWALAMTAVVAFLVMRSNKPETQALDRSVAPVRIDAGADEEPPRPAAATTAMWLDGEFVEVDDAALDQYDSDARATLEGDDEVSGGILPVADYGWIDSLDDEAVERAEDWLKRNRT